VGHRERHLWFYALAVTSLDSDLDARPGRSTPVTAGAIVLTGIAVALFVVVLTYAWHALAMASEMARAANTTGLEPTRFVELGFYEHDLVPVIVGLVLLVLFTRLIPRLARGSSSARTSSVVLSLLLAVGCLGVDRVWGATTMIRNVWRGGSASTAYMAQFIAAQRSDMPVWTDDLLATAVVAIPLAALLLAILLLLPASNDYFAAMRRSGQY
jgi:hypothetical protein